MSDQEFMRTALVTGASRGIGRAIATRLAADGAVVALHYGSDDAAAAEAVDSIRAAGGRAFPLRARFGTPDEDLDAMFDALDAGLREHAGEARLDVLVNNAGITAHAAIEDTTPEQYDALFAINVRAPFFVTQRALRRMGEGGRIVNVSSGAVDVATPEIGAYAMTKGALETLTRQLAKQLGPRGITVNAVQPSVLDTDMNAGWLRGNPQAEAIVLEMQAVKRRAEPADVAAVVAFLASPAAAFVTGTVVDATGGGRL